MHFNTSTDTWRANKNRKVEGIWSIVFLNTDDTTESQRKRGSILVSRLVDQSSLSNCSWCCSVGIHSQGLRERTQAALPEILTKSIHASQRIVLVADEILPSLAVCWTGIECHADGLVRPSIGSPGLLCTRVPPYSAQKKEKRNLLVISCMRSGLNDGDPLWQITLIKKWNGHIYRYRGRDRKFKLKILEQHLLVRQDIDGRFCAEPTRGGYLIGTHICGKPNNVS